MTPPLFLVHQSEHGNGGFVTRLKLGEQVLGRAIENEICLPLETISRTHARLSVEAGGVIVTDLGSTNGTWIHRKQILCSPLFPGERIQFGTIPMILSHDPSGTCGLDSADATLDARFLNGNVPGPLRPLSPAQTRVFDLFLQGMIEKQVAATLDISPHTVHNHARKIYEAYSVRSRVELLVKVIPRPIPQ